MDPEIPETAPVAEDTSATAAPAAEANTPVTTESLVESLRRDLIGIDSKPEQDATEPATAATEPSAEDEAGEAAPSTESDIPREWPKSAIDTVTKLRDDRRKLREQIADNEGTGLAADKTRIAELETQLAKGTTPVIVTSKERELESKIANAKALMIEIENSPDGITRTDKDGKETTYDREALAAAKVNLTVDAAKAAVALDNLRAETVRETQHWQAQAEVAFPFLKDPNSASAKTIQGILKDYPELRSYPKILPILGAAFTWATAEAQAKAKPGAAVKPVPTRKLVQVPKLPTGSVSLPTASAVDAAAEFMAKTKAGKMTRQDVEKYTLDALTAA